MRIRLLNATASGAGGWRSIPAGRYAFKATGDFGSGTVALEWRADEDHVAMAIGDADLSADGGHEVTLGAGQVRANLTGATNPDLLVMLYSL